MTVFINIVFRTICLYGESLPENAILDLEDFNILSYCQSEFLMTFIYCFEGI